METEHFQAPFRVITLGSIHIENNTEKPSTEELTAWLLSNKTKQSYTQLNSKKQVIAFQDRVTTFIHKRSSTPTKMDKSNEILIISTNSMY